MWMDTIALILVIVGALNWGSIGLFSFDVVGWLFGGQGAIVSRIIFTLVGLAGLWCISLLFRPEKRIYPKNIIAIKKRVTVTHWLLRWLFLLIGKGKEFCIV